MISPDAARAHLAYTEWATARLLGAARELSPDELVRDFGTADRSVLGTLTHVFGADRVWLARIRGGAQEWPREYVLGDLAADWTSVYARWQEWAAGLTDAAIAEPISYRDMKGHPWVSPVWQIVLHVVNHGTHHRGQVAGFLRSMGKTPPVLDLIAYYRSR
ncbi:MAG TPA: DinB family protein [Thermoanaerobaculia bacterium]|nr:DinB family protein [Thermoanaerobaculia bacterium]